jgi:anti-anti-sigma factor
MFFLLRMSKSVIRRAYRCDGVHSRRTRLPRLATLINQQGGRILVMELEGALFFGSADNLENEIDAALRTNTTYLILDLKRVREIDSTGARLMLRLHDALTKQGKHLLITHLDAATPLEKFLHDMGVTAAVGRNRIFADTDHAIEWAEDHLIMCELGSVENADEFPFGQLDVLGNFTPSDLATIKPMLERRTFAAGELIFREGDNSAEMFIIVHGSASVRINLEAGRETRLITFSPGTLFGEIALLDQEARSASVRADEPLVCYVLTRDAFAQLSRHHSGIAIKLITNLGRELSRRLRRANRTIYELAS